MTENDPPLYLDAQASTPLDATAARAMLPFLQGRFGNPHSQHAVGFANAKIVETARRSLARLLNAQPRDILFTSGATEANNTAVKGVLALRKKDEQRDHIVTLASEHQCLLQACRYAQTFLGARVDIVPILSSGLIDMAQFESVLSPRTALVSVMAANNEIGTLQPLRAIAEKAHACGAWLHSDAAQALGKIALPLDALDLASFSAHKSYGPIGIGALYIARRRRVAFEPLLHGGGQEAGLRSGTLSPMLLAGFEAACRMLVECWREDAQRLSKLADLFLARLESLGVDFALNGLESPRLPGNLNISLLGTEPEALLARAPELCFSVAAACAGAKGGSHVLRALGLPQQRQDTALRIGFHRTHSEAHARQAAEIIAQAISSSSSSSSSSSPSPSSPSPSFAVKSETGLPRRENSDKSTLQQ